MPPARVVTTCDRRPTRDELDSAIARFRGTFDQTPPVFSAKNIDGERSYDLARRGKIEQRDTRPKAVAVTVKRLEILSFDGDTARLDMQVDRGLLRALARARSRRRARVRRCPDGAPAHAIRRVRPRPRGAAGGRAPGAAANRSPSGWCRFREPAAGTARGDAAVGDAAGTAQERRGNGAQRPRRAADRPPTDRPAARPRGGSGGPGKTGQNAGFLHGWVVLGEFEGSPRPSR